MTARGLLDLYVMVLLKSANSRGDRNRIDLQTEFRMGVQANEDVY
ncbi:hypothetical protein [uncultured Rubinisphaera sp.]|tara:strand:+ start:544 stop:678 length:135 start_codon:yes stop_codon:yes gene_type:complete